MVNKYCWQLYNAVYINDVVFYNLFFIFMKSPCFILVIYPSFETFQLLIYERQLRVQSALQSSSYTSKNTIMQQSLSCSKHWDKWSHTTSNYSRRLALLLTDLVPTAPKLSTSPESRLTKMRIKRNPKRLIRKMAQKLNTSHTATRSIVIKDLKLKPYKL